MSSSRFYFDASNVIAWGPQPPVGIPRVEISLVREALRAGHHIIRYDRRLRELRLLSTEELQHLMCLLDDATTRTGAGPHETRVAKVRRLARLARGRADSEFERYLAGILIGDGRREGLTYQAAKLAVRASLRLGRGAQIAEPPGDTSFLADPGNRIFLSSRTTHDLTSISPKIHAKLYAILHDLIPLRGPPFFPARNAARFLDEATWMARHCTVVLTPSDFTRTEAIRRFPGCAAAFETVRPAGLLFEASRTKPPASPALPAGFPSHFALYCSTIEPRKNHAMLADVWARLQATCGEACPALYLVGRRGWDWSEAQAHIETARASGAPIAILPALSDAELIWLYQHALFGVFPSLVEGFGLGVAECLDFGVPVLISDAAALTEAAQGLMPIQSASNPEVWLDALERLVRNPDQLAGLRTTIATSYVRHSARHFFESVLRAMSR